jgi:DNA repair ATPase RecN
VVTKFREKLSESKQAVQKFDMGRFNLEKLNDVEVKEQYQAKMSNRFAAVENLDNVDVDINGAWKSITENINLQAQTI